MASRTLHVSRAANVEPSTQLARERGLLAAAARGESHLHVSTLEPAESVALGAFHRRPEGASDVAVWGRHTGGRALPTGSGFVLVTLALPHRSALTSDDRRALAPEQVMNRCVRGVLHALRGAGVDVSYPGLDLITHERRAIGALTFVEIGEPTLFQAVLAAERTLADGALLLDRIDPEGVVPMAMIPPTDATSLAETLGPRGSAEIAPDGVLRRLAAGYAETFGLQPRLLDQTAAEALTDAPSAAAEPPSPSPEATGARAVGLLGTVEAWTTVNADRIDRIVLAGDFVSPPDLPHRLSDALHGLPPRADEIERGVRGFLDRDRHYLLGLRPADLIDLLHRSATVAT